MSNRDEVIGKLRTSLVRFLVTQPGMSREDSEDVAQQTMVVLLSDRYRHLEEEADLTPLSFEIVRRTRLDFLRRRKRYEPMPEGHDPVSHEPGVDRILIEGYEDIESKARRWLDRLRNLLPGMSKRCRQLLELRLKGFSTDDIAAAMSMTNNYVLVAEHRCRNTIRGMQPEGSVR